MQAALATSPFPGASGEDFWPVSLEHPHRPRHQMSPMGLPTMSDIPLDFMRPASDLAVTLSRQVEHVFSAICVLRGSVHKAW